MPVRLLKPGLRTSEKFNKCSFMAQSAYVRLLTMVDDAGRYLANPRLLRSELFPLGDDRGADIPLPRIETMLQELENNGLILIYESESKSLLALTNWNERVRTESRYPEPPLQTNANKSEQMNASPPNSPPTPNTPPSASKVLAEVSFFTPDKIPQHLRTDPFREKWEAWVETRRGMKQKSKNWVRLFDEQLSWLNQFGESAAIEILSASIRNGWQGLFPPKQNQQKQERVIAW